MITTRSQRGLGIFVLLSTLFCLPLAAHSADDGDEATEELASDESGAVERRTTRLHQEEHMRSIDTGEWHHYGPFTTSGSFTASISGSHGDADLYVRRGAQPDLSNWDCRPYIGGSNESCTLHGSDVYYVAVRGWSAANAFLTNMHFNTTQQNIDSWVEMDRNEWSRYHGYPATSANRTVVADLSTYWGGNANLHTRRTFPANNNNYDCAQQNQNPSKVCSLTGSGTDHYSTFLHATEDNTSAGLIVYRY